jgi:PAS domain S-box-containing protein
MSEKGLVEQSLSESIHILHVDDEPDFAELAAAFIQRTDDRFDVITATSVEEGIERLSNNPIDCVVSDYDMPRKNGIDFLQEARQQREHIPFILFTGKGSEEVASKAISTGVSDYLQKETGTEQYTILANRIKNLVEQHRAEQTRVWLDAIITNSNDGIIMMDTDSMIRLVNPAVEELFGYSSEDLIGQSLAHIMPPRYRDNHFQAVARYLNTGKQNLDWNAIELPFLDSSGNEVLTSVSFSEITEYGDRRLFGIIRDISNRVQIEDELRESKEKLERNKTLNEVALNSVIDLYWILDSEGYVLDWSDESGETTGYTAETAVGMHATEFFPQRNHDLISQKIEELRKTGSMTVEAEFQIRDGECVPYRFDGTVLEDHDANENCLCGFGQDLSAFRS